MALAILTTTITTVAIFLDNKFLVLMRSVDGVYALKNLHSLLVFTLDIIVSFPYALI